jgi:uncharacterized protein YbjT (DUF2867 family)
MRILVIGATGLLQGKEIAGLLSRDHEVIGASRKGPALTVDISDKASIVAMYRQTGALDAMSPGRVAEALQAMERDPDKGVRAAVVAQAFKKCVVEDVTGQVVSVAR